MIKRIFIEDLNTSLSRVLAKYAAVILAEDDACPYEPIVLYGADAGETSNLLIVELNEGDSMLESTNLRAAVDFVTTVKGRCEFPMSHAGLPIEESADDDCDDCDGLFDDKADWWKGGDV